MNAARAMTRCENNARWRGDGVIVPGRAAAGMSAVSAPLPSRATRGLLTFRNIRAPDLRHASVRKEIVALATTRNGPHFLFKEFGLTVLGGTDHLKFTANAAACNREIASEESFSGPVTAEAGLADVSGMAGVTAGRKLRADTTAANEA